MSTSHPGFYILFRRSRYRRLVTIDDDSEGATAEREQRERFAAAAVGFCIKHCPDFRVHFWSKVCRTAGDSKAAPAWQVEIEPVHWADLRLTASKGPQRHVWVVELKAGAALHPRQNPDTPEFCRPNHGYGALFAADERARRSRLSYIVLGAQENLTLRRSRAKNLRLDQKPWSVLTEEAPDSSLVGDLFDSLGWLGISCFRMKEALSIQVGGGFVSAANAWEVLRVLGSEPPCRFRRADWKIKGEQPVAEHFNLGAYLSVPAATNPTSDVHRGLHRSLRPPGKILLWAGYESGPEVEPDRFSRSVYFYCSTKSVTSKLCDALKRKFPDCQCETIGDKEAWCARICAGANARRKDLVWFQEAIQTAAILAG